MSEIEKVTHEDKRIDKNFVKGFIITSVIQLVITIVMIIVQVYFSNRNIDIELYAILTDCFSLPGLFTVITYVLIFLSSEGAFDIISYSIQLVWYTTFYKNLRDTKLPKTYADYVSLKRAK